MPLSSVLSLVIPTFNRAELLDRCLSLQVPVARLFDVPIYISDNASTDATAEVIGKWKQIYPHIESRRNASTVDADANFEFAFKMPSTDFVWLLGDTYNISVACMQSFFDTVGDVDRLPVDALVFNMNGRVNDVPSGVFTEQNALLSQLAWHMTCMSTLVYSRELLKAANFHRYRNTYFLQLGIILENIEGRPFRIVWDDSVSVSGIVRRGEQKQGWQPLTFHIWIERWMNFAFSLPASYSLDAKYLCIKKHGAKSGVFGWKSLVLLRATGILEFATIRRYWRHFPNTVSLPRLGLLAFAITPRLIPKIIVSLYLKFVRRKDAS